MYKLHKKVQQLLLFYGNENSYLSYCQSTYWRYDIQNCVLYHITYTTLLYRPLRFILTFKSNRSMVSFGRNHCKYDMHIYFHASFLDIAFKYVLKRVSFGSKDSTKELKLSLMTNTILHKVFVRTIDYLYASINHYPQHVSWFYMISYLCAIHFFFYLKKQNIIFKKLFWFWFYITYSFLYLYTYSALLSRILFTRLL